MRPREHPPLFAKRAGRRRGSLGDVKEEQLLPRPVVGHDQGPSGAKLKLVAIVDEGSGMATSRAVPSAEYEAISLPPS